MPNSPAGLTDLGTPAPTSAADYNTSGGMTIFAGSSADAGRFSDFPQQGQIGRSGLLSVGPLMKGPTGAMRVFNPDRITLAEYDEMGLDPTLRACLLGYTLILQTADLSVSCEDRDMKALIESQFLPLLPALIRETIRPAMTFGWADAEILWETRYNVATEKAKTSPAQQTPQGMNGADPDAAPPAAAEPSVKVWPYVTAVKDFVPLNNTTLTLRQTNYGAFAGAVQYAWGEAFLPPSKLFHFPLDGLFRNPYGESALKPAYPFFYWCRFLYEMLMVAVERGAAPPVVGRYPAGMRIQDGQDAAGLPQGVDAGEWMLGMLNQLRSFSSVALPSQFDAKGNNLYSIDELQLEMHIDWLLSSTQMLNSQKMLSMFFPDKLLQGGDVGSYALAKEHTDLFSLGVKARLDQLLERVNKGPLAQFVRFNDRNAPVALITYAAPNIQAMQALSQSFMGAMFGGQPLTTQNADQVLIPDWQKLADDLGVPYNLVRQTDGRDALGNPLQSGADPQSQDTQAAIQAGLISPQDVMAQQQQAQGQQNAPGGNQGGTPQADPNDLFAPQPAKAVAVKPVRLTEEEDALALAERGDGFHTNFGYKDEGAFHSAAFGDMAPHVRGHYTTGFNGEGSFSGTVHHPETGKAIGKIERTFVPEGYSQPKIENEHFQLNKSAQGQGIAKRLLDNQDAFADKHQATQHLMANIDVGPYAWAKRGYEFDTDSERGQMRAHFHDTLNKNAEHYQADALAAHHATIDTLTHPKDFANFDTGHAMPLVRPVNGQTHAHFGKAAMTGQDDLYYNATKKPAPMSEGEGE